MKNLKLLFIFVLVFSGFLIVLISLNLQAAQTQLSAFPTSYAVGWKKYTDSDLGFEVNLPENVTLQKTDDPVMHNVIYIKRTAKKEIDQLGIKIVALDGDSKVSALDQLETYILSNVGTITKNNQKVYTDEKFQIAQIGYNPFRDDSLNYFSVYTLIKSNNRSWVIAEGYYADLSKTNSLDDTNTLSSSTYREILKTFISKDIFKKDKLNKIDKTKIDKFRISEFKKNNSKFETSF